MNKMIEIKHLSKIYASNNIKAVDDISFEVKPGEFFAFLGENGAGKSTTINIICTLLDSSDGECFVDGLKVGKDDDEIRKRLGVVFQFGVLDDVLTVRENIVLRAKAYIKDENLIAERLEELSEKLDITDILDKHYGKLSGGQKRKSDIARALIFSPRLLILDEPTTGLDPQSRIQLWEVLDKMRKNNSLTIFLTTHYMEEAEKADRIAIIHKGKIVAYDTPQRLKSKFSKDTLKLVAKDEKSKLKILEILKDFECLEIADTIIIKLDRGMQALKFLPSLEEFLDSFEMIKGNMDDVFLNVLKGNI